MTLTAKSPESRRASRARVTIMRCHARLQSRTEYLGACIQAEVITVPESPIMESSKAGSARKPKRKARPRDRLASLSMALFAGLACGPGGGGVLLVAVEPRLITKRDGKPRPRGSRKHLALPVRPGHQAAPRGHGADHRSARDDSGIRVCATLYAKVSGYLQGAERRPWRPGQEGPAPGPGLRPRARCRRASGRGRPEAFQAVATQAEARSRRLRPGCRPPRPSEPGDLDARGGRGPANLSEEGPGPASRSWQGATPWSSDWWTSTRTSTWPRWPPSTPPSRGSRRPRPRSRKPRRPSSSPQADLVTAKAEITVSEANLKKAKVFARVHAN